ncbi:hypothetical protein [Cohaesibacter gelatinilyticus]|uniref:Uncharacterized protein n=1 Tax=Cohaesibacter gelatinilyticus TaxID=372072 RepID=A0A285NHV9_9HYPH|nr:hypothetical protein [Cohaesibacter gelatinilyticus]SNZ07456.1 hypothetical protein SAMN06265368_0979 [Cohaesibacter gelatinilyticus]
MNKFRSGVITLRLFLRRSYRRFKIALTWRVYAVIIFVSLSLFCASVIALELLPSHWLINTTFVATLETQNLTFRNGKQNSSISGISGSSIALREINAYSPDQALEVGDLTQLTDVQGTESPRSKVFSKASEDSHLELDSFLIPAELAMEISTSGQNKYISLQIVGDDQSVASETTIVWYGDITLDSVPISKDIGSDRWKAISPLIEIQKPEIDGLIYSPIPVTALSTERLRLSGSNQIATSSLLEGEIQFYLNFPFGSYPTEPTTLRSGEFTQFNDLEAQITNLELTETGIRFLLVGKANAVKTGFLNNRRNITPSMLDGFRSIESLVIIMSSLFALLLAVLSAISLGRESER